MKNMKQTNGKQLRNKDVKPGELLLPGGQYAKANPAETSDAAIATMYAREENEHASASDHIDSDYTEHLRAVIPAPRGRRVNNHDIRMWSGIGFVASVPIVTSLASAATLTPMPLVVAAAAAALPAAGITLRNAILNLRTTLWEQRSARQREHDRPRIDAIKALAYTEAKTLQQNRWETTTNTIAQLRHDTRR